MLHSPTRTQLRQQDSTGNLDSENNDNTSLSQSQSRPIVTSGYNSQSNIEISATSVKLPQFWTSHTYNVHHTKGALQINDLLRS